MDDNIYNRNKSTILVTGATGTIGSELIGQVATTDTDVRALTRDPENAAWMEDFDVDVVEGDFREPASLDAALDGIDRAFLLSGIDRDQVELQGNVVEAAQRADIQHLVKLSGAGVGLDSPEIIAQWQGETEQQIEDSGLTYTHLRPGYYMQNLLWFAESIRRDGAFYQAIPRDVPVSMIDTRDIASVAATVLTEDGHENEDDGGMLVFENTGQVPAEATLRLSLVPIAETESDDPILNDQLSYEELPDEIKVYKGGAGDWRKTTEVLEPGQKQKYVIGMFGHEMSVRDDNYGLEDFHWIRVDGQLTSTLSENDTRDIQRLFQYSIDDSNVIFSSYSFEEAQRRE